MTYFTELTIARGMTLLLLTQHPKHGGIKLQPWVRAKQLLVRIHQWRLSSSRQLLVALQTVSCWVRVNPTRNPNPLTCWGMFWKYYCNSKPITEGRSGKTTVGFSARTTLDLKLNNIQKVIKLSFFGDFFSPLTWTTLMTCTSTRKLSSLCISME